MDDGLEMDGSDVRRSADPHRRGQAGDRARQARCCRGGARGRQHQRLLHRRPVVGLGRRRPRRPRVTNVGYPQRHRDLDRPVSRSTVRRDRLRVPPVAGLAVSEDAWSLRPEVARLTPYPVSAENEDVNAAAAANVLRYQLVEAGSSTPAPRAWCSTSVLAQPVPAHPRANSNRPPARWTGCGVRIRRRPRRAGPAPGRRTTRRALRRSRDGRPVAESAPGRGEPQPSAGASTGVADRTELYWVFTMLAAVLLLFELFASIRDIAARDWPDGTWRYDKAKTVTADPAQAARAVLRTGGADRPDRGRQDDFRCRCG